MSKKILHTDFVKLINTIHSELEILSEYKAAKSKILVKDRYGICEVIAECLLKSKPSIRTAIDKTSYWIEMVREIHNNKYDYSNSHYKGTHTKVEIICPIHKSFWQTPGNHSQFGCEQCAREICHGKGPYSITMAERNKEEWKNTTVIIYNILFKNENEEFIKVGITGQSLNRRFSSITMYDWKVLEEIPMSLYEATYLEDKIHDVLKDSSYIPKIKFGGYKECFLVTGHTAQDVLQRLKDLK